MRTIKSLFELLGIAIDIVDKDLREIAAWNDELLAESTAARLEMAKERNKVAKAAKK